MAQCLVAAPFGHFYRFVAPYKINLVTKLRYDSLKGIDIRCSREDLQNILSYRYFLILLIIFLSINVGNQ